MFIKWRHEETREGTTRWYAYLAESKRINGKPRQKVITYLASIEQGEDGRWIKRDTFWYSILCSMMHAGLHPKVCRDTLSLLGKRVSKPSYDEWDVLWHKEHDSWRKNHRWEKEKVNLRSVALERYQEYFEDILL